MKGLHVDHALNPPLVKQGPCSSVESHTPAPEGYLAWHTWAAEMTRKGFKQQRCPDCGRFRIWVKR